MKIAQVAPLIESVPPRLYGGTERIVSYLTEELVRLGHDVTLFANADYSITSAELGPYCTRALRLDPTVRDTIPHFMLRKCDCKAGLERPPGASRIVRVPGLSPAFPKKSGSLPMLPTRPGASPPTSPSCPSCCAGRHESVGNCDQDRPTRPT
jgi:hypothetical protein